MTGLRGFLLALLILVPALPAAAADPAPAPAYAPPTHVLDFPATPIEGSSVFLDGASEGGGAGVRYGIIGLTGDCDITAITKSACDIVEKTKFKDTMHAYSVLLATEKSICEVCAAENKKASLGSQNLLQAIADKSEMRQYKIQRRIKDV